MLEPASWCATFAATTAAALSRPGVRCSPGRQAGERGRCCGAVVAERGEHSVRCGRRSMPQCVRFCEAMRDAKFAPTRCGPSARELQLRSALRAPGAGTRICEPALHLELSRAEVQLRTQRLESVPFATRDRVRCGVAIAAEVSDVCEEGHACVDGVGKQGVK
eukprot:4261310-Pleurochrysis_carterae.AAC.2